MNGRKDDSGKIRYSLIPQSTVEDVVRVLEHGAIKYAPDNWKKVPDYRQRYYDATMRHLQAWWNGESLDRESNLHHLAHAICNAMFLLWFDRNHGKKVQEAVDDQNQEKFNFGENNG
jgi:hypothetical protein